MKCKIRVNSEGLTAKVVELPEIVETYPNLPELKKGIREKVNKKVVEDSKRNIFHKYNNINFEFD